MKNIINSLIIIAVTAVMLVTMSRFAVDTWTKPVETTAVPTTTAYKPKGVIPDSWENMRLEYKDIVGYIKIPGVNIDDPVVQGKDNDYYLRRSERDNGYYHPGCYFIDYRCDTVKPCQNITIYGHNLMDETRKFGQLMKYKTIEFCKQSPIIYFDTPTSIGEYKIFAAFITNVEENDGVIFEYRQREFETQEEFLSFTERCKRRSYFNFPVDIQPNDSIITLSTCEYSVKNWRFVVMARKLRDGELPDVDVDSIKPNENILYPEGWYRRFGGTMPRYDNEPLLSDPKTTAANNAN